MSTSLEYSKSYLSAEDFPYLGFTKTWESKDDFPTYEPDEAQVRADMQLLHDETKNFINNELIPKIIEEDVTNESRAAAEAARVDAEKQRVAAEQARVDENTGTVAQATDQANLSKSWAVGGTGVRSDEETNNAKYWCEQAKKQVNGGGGDMLSEIYDPQGKSRDIFEYVDDNLGGDIDCGTF